MIIIKARNKYLDKRDKKFIVALSVECDSCGSKELKLDEDSDIEDQLKLAGWGVEKTLTGRDYYCPECMALEKDSWKDIYGNKGYDLAGLMDCLNPNYRINVRGNRFNIRREK